jgi:hypothetical protein
LFEKTASNLQEAAARGGQVIVFSDAAGAAKLRCIATDTIVLPTVDSFVAPIVYAIAVQLLAYHVAVLKGTDVDQPRTSPSRSPWNSSPQIRRRTAPSTPVPHHSFEGLPTVSQQRQTAVSHANQVAESACRRMVPR